MAVDMTAVEELVSAVKGTEQGEIKTYTATVSRKDTNGVIWVQLVGADKETPTASTSAEVERGDVVSVEWRNNKLYIAGNSSNPSAGVIRVQAVEQASKIASEASASAVRYSGEARLAAEDAKQTADSVHGIAIQAQEDAAAASTAAGNAGRAASTAQAAAEAAQETANQKKVVFITEPTTPYHAGDLWVNTEEVYADMVTASDDNLVDSSSDLFQAVLQGEATVYVCKTTRLTGSFEADDWKLAATDNSQLNELREWFWHDAAGAHVLGDATGFRNDITSTGMNIVDTSTETSVAEFGSSGVRIGQDASGASRAVLSADGMQIYRNVSGTDTQIANLGYGSGAASGGGTAVAPFYTFGTRQSYAASGNRPYGNYSVVEGVDGCAYGEASHVEGSGNYAYDFSHAEGLSTSAGGGADHAEGVGTSSTANAAHAEGRYTQANGPNSHAQNSNTIAGYESQTAIGKYNDNNINNAFEIGNGTSNARSNALTVDWSGNVNIPTGAAYKVNGTSLIDLIYPVGSIYMSVNNTSPQTLFGGTWQQIQDTFLLAAGSTYTAGGTGGTASNTLAEANLPKITGTVKLASNIARNTDTASTLLESASGKFTRVESTNQNVVKLNSSTSTVSTGKTLYTSAKYEFGQTTPTALNNLPPYLAVYVWQRTS